MTHSRTPHKDKSDCYFIPAGEAFSPACFVMPFFSCANFAGLFSLQLLTFVCRTPRTLSGGGIIRALTPSSNGLEKRPKLRFPGFDEPWRAEKLSDFAERVTRKNSNNETDLPLTISSKDGLVDQISYFNKTVASKDMSGYYLLRNGEYAYNKSYSVGYDFGSIKRLDRYPMGALSTLYICFALKKHDTDFIKVYFDSLKWYKEIYMISAEGAEYSARDCAARPLKLSIHSGGIEHACRRR